MSDMQDSAKDNAAFIVRACNSHKELLEIISWLLCENENNPKVNDVLPDALLTRARLAIAKAEGK